MAIRPTTSTSHVHAGNLCDATGNTIESAEISFTPCDVYGRTIPLFHVGGGGLSGHQTVTATVTDGTFSTTLITSAYTDPENVAYSCVVKDLSTKRILLGPFLIQPTPDDFNLDQFSPDLGAQALIQSGPPGPQGIQGPAGPPNALSIGTVTQGAAAATISGSAPNQSLNLTLPPGPQGVPGEVTRAQLTQAQALPVTYSTQYSNLVTLGSTAGATTGATANELLLSPKSFSAGFVETINVAINVGAINSTFDVIVMEGTYPSSMTITRRFTVTLRSAISSFTVLTLQAGVDFAAFSVSALSYLGVIANGGAQTTYINGGVSTDGVGYLLSDPGSSTVALSFLGSGHVGLSFNVRTLLPRISQSDVDTSVNGVVGALTATQPTFAVGDNGRTTSISIGSNLTAKINTPASNDGNISKVVINFATISAGNTLDIAVFSSATGTPIVARRTLTPAAATGLQTFKAGIDFAPLSVLAGQFLGLVLRSTSPLPRWSTSVGTPPGVSYTTGDPGSSGATYGTVTNGYIDLAFTVVSDLVYQSQIPVSRVNSVVLPYTGKKWVNLGDSYSANFSNVWQNKVIADTGLVLTGQYAAGGKTCSQAIAISNNWIFGNFMTGGVFDPSLLATALAGADIVTIALLTNDARYVQNGTRTLGTSADSSATATLCGDIRYALEKIHAANPNVRVMWITPLHVYSSAPQADGGDYTGYAYTNATCDSIITQFKLICGDFGDHVIDMAHNSGFNSYNVCNADGTPFWLRDRLHPTDLAFTKYFAPLVSRGILDVPLGS